MVGVLVRPDLDLDIDAADVLWLAPEPSAASSWSAPYLAELRHLAEDLLAPEVGIVYCYYRTEGEMAVARPLDERYFTPVHYVAA